MPQLRDTLHQMNKDILPQATVVVNSGTGLHLYYVLKEPVPMYPYNQKCLKELKYSLTRQIWNKFTSTIKEPQMQGILQGFRVVGSGSVSYTHLDVYKRQAPARSWDGSTL